MCGSHVWLVTYSLCLPPGNSHWRRRSHQQSAALLYRERRPSAAVLYSPPQWRNHCPHCAGQRGGQCELKHKKKRIQIKRGKELNKRQKKKKLNFICLLSRSLITLWRCRQQMKVILLSPRRCSSPSLSPMSTTTHPSSLRLTTVCCCRYDNHNISHDMSVHSSHS